jgi:RNA polymerase sigma factor (sigma-70 family)
MRVVTTTDVGLLVRAAAGGDEDSWNALVDQFAGLVWSVVRSYRVDHATAADVVQETWFRQAGSLDRLRNPERVGAWLVTTARHETLRVLRQLDRQQPTEFDDELLVDAGADLDDGLLRAESRREVLAALESLSPSCQQLLRLLVAEPKISYEDVASMLGVAVGSVGP